MDLGLSIVDFDVTGGPAAIAGALADIGRRADAAGLTSLWVMDHFFQIPPVGPAEKAMLEGYTTLGYLAAVTERVTLGTLVTGVTYRYPGLLAKTVTTLDVLSGGRAWLGIGAAWFDREHEGLGVPYPSVATRFELLEDALQICEQMFSGEVGPIEVTHTRLAETLNSPPALSTPRPRIMIGGSGERKTLRMVAQYADACNLFGLMGPEFVRDKLAVLRGHCEALGTDYDKIEKTILYRNLPTDADGVSRFCDEMAAMAELGVTHVIVGGGGETAALQRQLDVAGEQLVPALAGI